MRLHNSVTVYLYVGIATEEGIQQPIPFRCVLRVHKTERAGESKHHMDW